MEDMRQSGFEQGELKLVLYIAAAQLTLVTVMLLACLASKNTTQSSGLNAGFFGALIGFAASSSFALVSLRSGKQRSAGKILTDLYLGQAVKWIVIVSGMTVTFRSLPDIDQGVNVLILLGVFLLTQSAYLIVPTMLKKI